MTERRDFLRAASLLPLGSVSTGAASSAESKDYDSPFAADNPNGTELPKPGPVEEKKFTEYHLLGKPDPEGKLFGDIRPQEWSSTKRELAQALLAAAHEGDPIHRWLKTFDLTFDDRASSIVLDGTSKLHSPSNAMKLRYEPQLYEASLRSASALLDRCLRYRNEMGNFETSGITSGIGYLAFLKLKPLQRNFIIQSSSADLEEIEAVTQNHASVTYNKARPLDKWLEKYHLRALQIQAAGGAAEASLAEAKDKLRTKLLEKQFHITIDAQLAQFTRLVTPGSSSNYAERYLRMLSLLTEDLADIYCKLYSASKGLQQVLKMSQVTVGLGSPINLDIPAFNSLDSLKSWVKSVIPPQDGDQRKPDVLDALVLWTRAVMREMDRRSQYETEFTVSVPLNQPWGKKSAVLLKPSDITAAFNAGGNSSGKVTFDLGDDTLPFATIPQNIRIIGIGLSVEHSIDDASPAQYSTTFPGTPVQRTQPDPTPAQVAAVQTFELPKMARLYATLTPPQQTLTGVGGYSRSPILLSNVRIQGGNGGELEPTLSYDIGCRNLYPFGSWTIALDPNVVAWYQSVAPIVDSWIGGLILHLRLRGSLA